MGGPNNSRRDARRKRVSALESNRSELLANIQSDTTISGQTKDELIAGLNMGGNLSEGEEALKKVSETFDKAKQGLGSKFKSRQTQKRTGELLADQPGVLQTRIVR